MPPTSTTVNAFKDIDALGLASALAKARKSYREGGIPIGAALIYHGAALRDTNAPSAPNALDARNATHDPWTPTSNAAAVVLGCAHNQRIQKSSPTLHAEIAALEDAGRLGASVYRNTTMYTTLSPCAMCTGAILLYKIPRVVIGENTTFGDEDLLRRNGVEVVVLDDPECKVLMERYTKENPEVWNEDIGE